MSNGNAEQPTAQAPERSGLTDPRRGERRRGVRVRPEPRCAAAREPGRLADAGSARGEQRRRASGCQAAASRRPARARAVEGLGHRAKPSGTDPPAIRPPADSARPQCAADPTEQAPAPDPAEQPQRQRQSPQPRLADEPQPRPAARRSTLPAQAQPAYSIAARPGTPGARPARGASPGMGSAAAPAPGSPSWTRLGFGRKAERPEGNGCSAWQQHRACHPPGADRRQASRPRAPMRQAAARHAPLAWSHRPQPGPAARCCRWLVTAWRRSGPTPVLISRPASHPTGQPRRHAPAAPARPVRGAPRRTPAVQAVPPPARPQTGPARVA